MKRVAAVLVLVTALTLLAKLAFKRPATPGEGPTSVGFENLGAEIESRSELDRLLEKYPENGNLVRQVVEKYRRTATEIEAKEGLRGLKLLDRLDLEAIFLFERHPEEFARLAGAVGDDAAADLLTHWAGVFRPETGRRPRSGRLDRGSRATLQVRTPGRRALTPKPCP